MHLAEPSTRALCAPLGVLAGSGAPPAPAPRRTITIPGRQEHVGIDSMTITVPWRCLHCGGPRGEPFPALSFDGSRRLSVDSWHNPCGHTEKYSIVRRCYGYEE